MRLMIVMVILLYSTAVARAYTDQQENVLNNLAEAMAAAWKCPSAEFNSELASVTTRIFDLNNAEALREIAARASVKSAELDQEEEVLCFSARFLFGPDGQNVPNLLKF